MAIERRRLTARSVLASTLLGVSPPTLPTRSLVATAELLGIAPGTARVALSRMVAARELAATSDGYRLVSPALLARQASQDRSRRATTVPWGGDWTVWVVNDNTRSASERTALRLAMARRRHEELREGVWLRPANLPDQVLPDPVTGDPVTGDQPAGSDDAVTRQCIGFTASPDDPTAVVAQLWDLATWSRDATDLLTEMGRLRSRLDGGDTSALADGFVTSAAVLRHLQADPLLPPELLPDAWPAPWLRLAYERYDASFRDLLATWQRHHRVEPKGAQR